MGERRSGGSAVPLDGREPPNTGDVSSACTVEGSNVSMMDQAEEIYKIQLPKSPASSGRSTSSTRYPNTDEIIYASQKHSLVPHLSAY